MSVRSARGNFFFIFCCTRCCWHKISSSLVGLGISLCKHSPKPFRPKYFHFSWSKYNYRLIIRPNSRKYKMSYHLYCRYNSTKCKQIDEPQWLPLLQECLVHNNIWFINKMLNYSFNIEQRRNFYRCIADFYLPAVCLCLYLCPQKIARSFNSHQVIRRIFAEYTTLNILRW